jgi:hypothetical protein
MQAAMNGETAQSEQMIGLFKFAAVSLRKKDLLLIYHERSRRTPYPLLLERATRALYPWPGVWTKVTTKSGEKRLKILSSHLNPKPYPQDPILIVDQVQLEGKQPTKFSQLQALLA